MGISFENPKKKPNLNEKQKEIFDYMNQIVQTELKHKATTAKSKVIKQMPNVYPEEVEPRKVAVGIVYDEKNQFLLLQRYDKAHFKDSFQWVFPHDMVKENETNEDAVRRAIYEQVNAEVDIVEKLGRRRHFYTKKQLYKPDQYRHIEMHAYMCRLKSKNVKRIHHKRLLWKRFHLLFRVTWDEAMVPFIDDATDFIIRNHTES